MACNLTIGSSVTVSSPSPTMTLPALTFPKRLCGLLYCSMENMFAIFPLWRHFKKQPSWQLVTLGTASGLRPPHPHTRHFAAAICHATCPCRHLCLRQPPSGRLNPSQTHLISSPPSSSLHLRPQFREEEEREEEVGKEKKKNRNSGWLCHMSP